MKLKNFIKKPKIEESKNKKTFSLNKKFNKTNTRGYKKINTKKTRRVLFLSIISASVFAFALILFLGLYVYRSFIKDQIGGTKILSPGIQYIIEVNEAENILKTRNIDINSLEYSTESGALTLIMENGTRVFFSDEKSFHVQANLLHEIIYTLKLEGKEPSVIDFRYNRPIVNF